MGLFYKDFFYRDRFLIVLAILLLGYSIGGKGFASLGVPPFYIGELVLFSGILHFIFFLNAWKLFGFFQIRLLLVFMLWEASCTLPYLGKYGIYALRDAVIWGYGMYAIVVAGLVVSNPWRLCILLVYYRRFIRIFLWCMPMILLLKFFDLDVFPTIPGTTIPIISVKIGDVFVHFAGIVACGVTAYARFGVIEIALLGISMTLISTSSRAGLLAFMAAFGTIAVLRPFARAVWKYIVVVLLLVFLLWVIEIEVGQSNKFRPISIRQLTDNVESVIDGKGSTSLGGSRWWRLLWWRTILNYTVFGKYFWQGKGFGVNLANDDGFQVCADHELRSPHNGHLTILARSGVPGFALWILLQLTWSVAMLRSYLLASKTQNQEWAGLFLFLLAYWVAFMVNSAFDVYLEGPMGGIWFWVIYGMGVGTNWIYYHHPQILADYAIIMQSTRNPR